MRKLLGVLVVALCCTASAAVAGPNAGGTLVAHQPNLLTSATDGDIPVCGQTADPTSCFEMSDRIIGAVSPLTARIWKVYAVFPSGSSPRLMGVAWGLTYDGSHISIDGTWNCGSWELKENGWPGPGLGDQVTWSSVQTAHVVPVYTFSSYTDGTPGIITLAPHPLQGGHFGDDTIPAVLDDIVDYGGMGFDTNGHLLCPAAACCHDDGSCTVVVPDNCLVPGVWHGQLASCSPNPCPQAGACCDPNTGACTLIVQTACVSPKIWHVEWTTCSPNPCPPVGACCDPNTGACGLVLEANCALPGIWHGGWTTCSPNPCPQVGACCAPIAGTCTVTLAANCTAPSVWHGEWTSCVPDRCPTSDVPAPVSAGASGIVSAAPNPFTGSTELCFRLSEAGHVRLDVFDPAGHTLRSLDAGTMEPGVHVLQWDGRTSGGAPVAPGVYFARLRVGAHAWTRSLIRIK